MASHADVTVLTGRNPFPLTSSDTGTSEKASYYTLAIDNGRVTKMYMNSTEPECRISP